MSSKAINIPLKLPPLSDPKFVERFRQTRDQNFITHFYECFKKLHFPDRIVHNNAKEMLKIIIQQRKELLDKLSNTNEALVEMEERLKNSNKEIDIKDKKLEEQLSKNGTIMFHMNGLNRKYDLMEKEKAELINKLSISEQTVNKWVNSAMEDHNEAGKYKAENEELQKQLKTEKENSKKMNDKANAAQKECENLMEQKKVLDQQIETLKKQQQEQQQKQQQEQQQKRDQKEIAKNAKRPRQNFQVGFNSPTTSAAHHQQPQQQQQVHQPSITSPPDLPSFTPPEKSLRSQESLQQLQNYVVFQESHFGLPSNQICSSNNGQGMSLNGLQQNLPNTPLLIQKLSNQSINSKVSPQQPILMQQVSAEAMAAAAANNNNNNNNNNTQIQQQHKLNSPAPFYYLIPSPLNVHCQQQQQQSNQQQQPLPQQQHSQQQQMQFIQSLQQQQQPPNNNNMHISPAYINQRARSRPQSKTSSSQMNYHQKIAQQQQQQQCLQVSNPTNIFTVPPNNIQQRMPSSQTRIPAFQSPQHAQNNHSITPQNMQLPLQTQLHASQINSHQQQLQVGQQQTYNGNLSMTTVPQNFTSQPSNEFISQLSEIFNSLPLDQQNRLLHDAGVGAANPAIEISH